MLADPPSRIPMPALPAFRHYCICQDSQGGAIELWRGPEEVACLAFDTRRQVLVELHVAISPAEKQRELRSFQNLLQLAAPLRHRHLLGIIEGGEDDGANFHVTDFLDGERLDTWLKRLVPLPPWLALSVLLQLVEGLAALASHPRLLAGVEVFHAGVMLSGERVEDLVVKVCDLGLAGSKPMSTEPQFVEARAIHEAGRLLHFMLTGSHTEGAVTLENLPGSRATPELNFLLDTIFQAAAPHHPRTLEQLRNLVERCLHDLPAEQPARPDKLPASFRPLLPLAPFLPDGAAVAEAAGEDCSLDPRPGDSAQPYRHRGTERATRHPVLAQILPPPEIVPAEFFAPLLDQAWAARSGGGAPGLLKPRGWNSALQPPVLVEELPGKWTWESLVRARRQLEPAEVLLLLRQLDAAADAANALGLPLLWRSPKLVPLQFAEPGVEESQADTGKLARLPLTDWPAFLLKFRTWPLMLNFTQPERFQLERLLPRDPGLPAEAPAIRAGILTPPTSRDLALLAVWMMGGSSQLREGWKPLLLETLRAKPSAAESRRDFLERFQQRVESAASARAPEAELGLDLDSDQSRPGKAGESDHGQNREAPGQTPRKPISPFQGQPSLASAPGGSGGGLGNGKVVSDGKSTASPGGKSAAGRRNASRRAALSGAMNPASAGLEFVPDNRTPTETGEGPFSQAILTREAETDSPAMGFAEALFGASSSAGSGSSSRPAETHPLFGGDPAFHNPGLSSPHEPDPDIPEGAPLGFMEAAARHGEFQSHAAGPHLPPRRSPWMLLLVVILISAAIAALMAELSGRAIWHR